MLIQTCPCQSHEPQQKNYSDCCQPYHINKAMPTTAEQLMRSRYSAYVLQDIDYIVKTTLPNQQALLDIQAIIDWSQQTDWAGLEIIKHKPKVGKHHAQVEFKAYFNVDDGVPSEQDFHHELSAFVKIKDKQANTEKWYFIDPTVNMKVAKVTMKQPYICGSGEKFKRCCGRFL